MKTMKKFIFGLTALLSVSVFLTGCPTEAETKTVTVEGGMIHLDVDVTTEAALAGYLAQTGSLAIGVSDDIALTDNLTVGAGKLVYILNGAELKVDTATKTLTVEGGAITVGYGGKLSAEATKLVSVKSGSVSVVQGGELDVDVPGSINNGTENVTALGGTNVSISNGTLTIGTLADKAKLEEAFGWVPSGELAVTTLSTATYKPSEIAGISGISLNRRLYLGQELGGEETVTSLTIPAGLTLATSDDLGSITGSLEVNGNLEASSATLSAETAATVTVGPQARVELGTVEIAQSSVGTSGRFEATAVTFDGTADLDVSAGGTVNGIFFPVSTDVKEIDATDGVTIGNITIPASTTFTLPATTPLIVDGVFTFTNNTSRVFLPATAVIGATADGTFKATPTAANGAGVTLGVYASTDLATLTGFTSNNASAPATVTLTSASAGSGTGSAYVIGNASFLVNNVSTAHAATSETSTNAASAGAGSIAAAASTTVILAGAGA